jgi:hypothetical protein
LLESLGYKDSLLDTTYYTYIAVMLASHLKIVDLTQYVSLPKIRRDFSQLTIDPYIREKYRRKHIVRYNIDDERNLIKAPHGPLFQSAAFNPVHGNIMREYPEYHPCEGVLSVIRHFVYSTNVQPDEEILVQAQRITCSLDQEGLPSVENWHQDGVKEIGIFCVSRDNIVGGVSEFRQHGSKMTALSEVLEEGSLAIFTDSPLEHRVTPIQVFDTSIGVGFRDVLLLSYPSNRS